MGKPTKFEYFRMFCSIAKRLANDFSSALSSITIFVPGATFSASESSYAPSPDDRQQ